MKRVVIALTLVLAIGTLAVGTLAAAPRGHHGVGHGFGHGFGRGFGPLARLAHAKRELGPSDQQTARIRAIFAETRAETAPYRAQLRGGYKGVMQTLLENPNDVTGAQQLIEQQANAERALKTTVLNGASKALAVLTPAQREKLRTMIGERARRHGR